MVRLLWNETQTRPLNPRPQMWPSGLNLAMTLTLNFQGQIWNLLYLSQKWSYCHKMKSKYIDSTLGLKCDHQFWLCPWPWLEFSRVDKKFAISQPKVVQLPQNEKQIYRLNSRPQMWPMGLTITMTVIFEFSRSSVTLPFHHTHDLNHGNSWSNFEISVSHNGRANWHWTKWVGVGHSWPRSGVRIYQIVTGVTSDVGMPSTNLVLF